jgi:hypothetical protein
MPIDNIKVVKRDGEWVVLAYGPDNKRLPSGDYFASDKQDAETTAVRMMIDATMWPAHVAGR